jgi:hypothetical protein
MTHKPVVINIIIIVHVHVCVCDLNFSRNLSVPVTPHIISRRLSVSTSNTLLSGFSPVRPLRCSRNTRYNCPGARCFAKSHTLSIHTITSDSHTHISQIISILKQGQKFTRDSYDLMYTHITQNWREYVIMYSSIWMGR